MLGEQNVFLLARVTRLVPAAEGCYEGCQLRRLESELSLPWHHKAALMNHAAWWTPAICRQTSYDVAAS